MKIKNTKDKKIIQQKIRLLIIEDNRILREGIVNLLKSYPEIEIIDASESSDYTLVKIYHSKPGVILVDTGLRSQNSLRMISMLKKESPGAKIILMDLSPVHADLMQFVKAGASGFILKDSTKDDFLMTIKKVANGAKVIPEGDKESLFSYIVEQAITSGKLKLKDAVRMTEREREIIELIGEALSNREIARKTNLSEFTIKSYVHHIMEKLALNSRTEVAEYAVNSGSLKIIRDSLTTINK
jgi:DNA-binding NarL/FixJ family response regulator